MEWHQKRRLAKAAIAAQFRLLDSSRQEHSLSQNVANLPCLIIVLDVLRNTLPHLKVLLPKLLKSLADNNSKQGIVVIKAQ